MPTACSSVPKPWRLKKCSCAISPRARSTTIETRRREVVPFTDELRRKTEDTAAEMNRYFARGYTPKVKPGKHCNACSLKSICLPVLCSRADPVSYLRAHIFESEEDTP